MKLTLLHGYTFRDLDDWVRRNGRPESLEPLVDDLHTNAVALRWAALNGIPVDELVAPEPPAPAPPAPKRRGRPPKKRDDGY